MNQITSQRAIKAGRNEVWCIAAQQVNADKFGEECDLQDRLRAPIAADWINAIR